MEFHYLLTFIAVAALLVISPGPNGFLIAKTVSTSGRKAGFANVWGFVTAFYVHGTLSIFGISVFILHCAEAFTALKLLGAVYLIGLGVKAFICVAKTSEAVARPCGVSSSISLSMRDAYMEGFLTNMLNPKVSMFYLAAFPQFLTVNDSPVNAYMLVSAHATINFVWFSLMVLCLSSVKNVMDRPKTKKWLNMIAGTILMSFGVKLALLKP
ncbi:LysE family translocator [Celerinatantimonas yamalensis]|uniref:LysE family translocator n=1 Tax=Celerinatantimonas yamalensis TaxID=559956 RepID=A0ABW9GBR6_9GAMM